MIFATVGSHPTFRFDRFLKALERVPGENLIVQYGPGEPPGHARRAAAWMPFSEVLECMESAETIISHAGAGTILCAVQAGHVPVVLPRLRQFNETVDDHQLHLARGLAKTGRIIIVESEAELADRASEAPCRGAIREPRAADLVGAIREEIAGSVGAA